MRYRQAILALVIAAATMLQTGCGIVTSGGTGNTAVTGGSGSGSFETYTLLTTGVWPNAILNGSADPTTASCLSADPPDIKCSTSFSDINDGSAGEFIFSTDAIPAYWSVAAQSDSNCPAGGSKSGYMDNPGSLYIYCGGLDATEATASPASCTVIYVNSVLQGECSPYLTITTPSSVLPTSYALTAGWYTDEAASESSSNNTASSSTQITVPAPTSWGLSVITIVDPTTGEVLGATDYELHECFITAGEYGESESCPY